MSSPAGRLLRWLAALLVRGPDAPFIIGDLDEGLHRDVERGLSPAGAHRRYLANVLASSLSIARARAAAPFRRFAGAGASLLDLKLALRMLVKYPGLTGVAVFALALGIPASLAPIHLLGVFDAKLPFEEGERIIGLRHRYVAELEEKPGSFHEYTVWRETLAGLDGIGAARSARVNVIADDGRVRPLQAARMTASSFAIVRVPPLLGRPLLEADEVVGAPDVVVIGHDLWQRFFDGDPDVPGRTLRVGGVPHTVVGVMPAGFRFPIDDALWLPLRPGTRAEAADPDYGPELFIFARLADGASEEQVLAGMQSVHRGLAEQFPEPYAEVRPEIVPFTYLTTGNPPEMKWILGTVQLFALVLLAIACGNVGTLVLARTAARSGEVAVRTALGASRARIVSQFFVESVVLALLATGLGLFIAGIAAERVERVWDAHTMPFWFDFGLTPRTVALALGVAVFSAVIAGLLPALRATGRAIHENMQRLGDGRSSIRFGHATTVLIVVEVAFGVFCLFAGVVGYRWTRLNEPPAMEIRPREMLTAEMRLPPASPSGPAAADTGASRLRLASAQRELMRRLREEPGVRGVAFTRFLPGQGHGAARIEVEGEAAPAEGPRGHVVLEGAVDPGFFEGLGQRIVQGRDFAEDDVSVRLEAGHRVVIVNTTFVERVLRGRNPIGARVREVGWGDAEPGPWHEIVGVVGHLGMLDTDGMQDDAGLYHPVAPGRLQPARMVIRLAGDPLTFAPRLRQVAATVDPELMILNPRPLGDVVWEDRLAMQWAIVALAIVASIFIVLSIAGLYALMSFTVAQRRHEIGVRAALGAAPADIASLIVRRALGQLALGIALGMAATAALIVFVAPGAGFAPLQGWPAMLAAAAGVIVLIGAAACIAPTRRGLGIRPIDALKAN